MTENKYKQAASTIEKAAKYVDQPELGILKAEQVKLRLDILEKRWVAFCGHHEDLLTVAEGDRVQELINEMDQCEANYFKAAGALKEKLKELEPNVQIVQNDKEPQINVQVNMPFNENSIKNTWGDFDGDFKKWQGFHDRFVDAIHSKEDIAQSVKFRLLKASLVGQAKSDFGEWLESNEGYDAMWSRLVQMYDKKYLVQHEYLRQFFQLRVVQGVPTSKDLKHLANVTHESMRQLKAHGLPVEHWDFVIVHCLRERLDPETRRSWELQRKSDNPPASEMLDFIEKQAETLPNVQINRQPRTEPSTVQVKINQQANASSSRTKQASNVKVKCDICHDDPTALHQIWDCPQFLSLSLRSRKEYVERRNICPNCLKRGHNSNNCFQKTCVRCPGNPPHNIHLCPTYEVNKPALTAHRVQSNDKWALVKKDQSKSKVKKD